MAKLRLKYRDPIYLLSPQWDTLPLRGIHLLKSKERTMMYLYYPNFIVYMRVHSKYCIF